MAELSGTDFLKYISTLDVNELHNFRAAIDNLIFTRTSPSHSIDLSVTRDINDYVQYTEDRLVDPDTESLLHAEIESLKFTKKTQSLAVQNAFISDTAASYEWSASKGPVVNRAINLASFPVIKSIMDKINCDNGCKMNSVLVSQYKDGDVSASLHDDNEDSLDPTQPICVLSLGAERKVEFVFKGQESFRSNVLTLKPVNTSMYVMKAGCQDYFKHRVRKDRKVKEQRISLSFRCFTTDSKSNVIVDDVHSDPPTTPVIKSAGLMPINVPRRDVNSPSVGFSPYSGHHNDTMSSYAVRSEAADLKSNERLCILLGTSITEQVDASRMSRGNRTLVNLSGSGYRIKDVQQAAVEFCKENPSSIGKVDKIILNVGTNEIKFFNSLDKNVSSYFWSPLCNLVQTLKYLFRNAQIIFQSILPMRIIYKFNVKSVHLFNRLLMDLCERYGCIFYDCFGLFLDEWEWDINFNLYSSRGIHLNSKGLGILCRALKYLIHRNVFNPHPRLPFKPFYPY